MKWIYRSFGALFVLYAIICAAAFFGQRALLYFPPPIYLTPQAVGAAMMTEVPLRIKDGTELTAWWSPPAREDGKIVIVFHGNGSAVYSNVDIYSDLIAAGHGVWGVAYPGYPGSEGAPSQAALVDAARAQYAEVLARNTGGAEIVFYGTSLGSGVASQLAAQHPPSLLILDAPFNSVLDMAKSQMPFLPVNWLLRDKFQSDEALAGQDIPLIWTHGTADRIVPLAQGQKLFGGYDGPKIAHIIEGGQHTNLWFLGGREIVLSALETEAPL